MKPLKCLIVDDEPLARDLLRRFIAEHPALELTGEAGDGIKGFDLILDQKPDLLFLDVQMPEMNGLELLEAVKQEGVAPLTIFVTAHDAYAIRAFEANALDYLLKPFDSQRFLRAVQTALERITLEHRARYADRVDRMLADRKLSRIVVRTDGRLLLLRPTDIDWVEAQGNYVLVHMGAVDHTIRTTLREFTARLPPALFVRIHRSAVVNVGRVAEVKPWYTGESIVVLATGRELTLSRTYRQQFFEAVGQGAVTATK